jgi:hypothetical protein
MDADRFWSKVDRRGDGECWPWLGARLKSGYGSVGHRRARAHRVAWQMSFGDIPSGQCVLHACDSPPCVNPAHLWLGTHAENMADMRAKGRQMAFSGERNGGAKLTESDIRAIRAACAAGETQCSVAVRFGVSNQHVSCISRGQKWRHVAGGCGERLP